MEQLDAHVPVPGSDRGAWCAATALGVLGLVVLALALSGIVGGSSSQSALPPAVLAVAATPAPASATNASAVGRARWRAAMAYAESHPSRMTIGAQPSAGSAVGGSEITQVGDGPVLYEAPPSTHIAARWMQSFYPIYTQAQRTFGVNWLLIASIHKQESAFSTAPGIYHGLNFAGCCGGPMQFNVTNGPVTTWSLVSNSYRYGARPASYDHMTVQHPSIYDDFDSIMAAAHLLSTDGASAPLDGSAWSAAYDYYGHDATGVTYADQVLARAISWSQHGFCINCGVPQAMVEAVHAAYGAPVATSLEAEVATVALEASKPRRPARSARPRRGR